jgi:DNA repair exonuclease SbcCD ATPase subunit
MTDVQPLSEREIAEVEAYCDAASAPPWEVATDALGDGVFQERVGGHAIIRSADYERQGAQMRRNAEFIARARTDLPRLLATLRQAQQAADTAQAENAQLRTFVDRAQAEWKEMRAERDAAQAALAPLRQQAAALAEVLERVQWAGVRRQIERHDPWQSAICLESHATCPVCRGTQPNHETDCWLRAALQAAAAARAGESARP